MPINVAFVAHPRLTLNPESPSSRQGCPEALFLLRRLIEYLGIRGDIDLLCITGELLAPSEPPPALTALQAILDKAPFPVLVAPAPGTAGAEPGLEMFGKERFRDLKGFRIQACDFPPEQELTADSLHAALGADPATAVAEKRIVILPAGCRPAATPGAFSPDLLKAHNIAVVAAAARSRAMAGGPNLAGLEVVDDFAEAPYPFTLLALADGDQAPARQDIALRLPLPLRDLHTHSHFAYCNDNLDLAWESRLMDALNLSGTAITEHSGHLFFSRQEYWGKHWYPGTLALSPQHNRTAAYRDFLALAAAQDRRFLPGLEIDIDQTGRIIVDEDLLQATRFRLGAVHFLSMAKPTPETPGAVDEFMHLTERLITSGLIQALAHPFRVFAWDGAGDKPTWVFDRVVGLLKRHNVAAEINFHHNRPDPVFTRKCLDAGVKISLGSDTHSLYELGAFLPHLDFLRQIGYDGDWRDILVNAE